MYCQTPLHVSGVSIAHHQEVHPARTTDSHLKRIISTNCCIHTVVPTDYWAIDTPETCRSVWRNILKINWASSWNLFKRVLFRYFEKHMKYVSTLWEQTQSLFYKQWPVFQNVNSASWWWAIDKTETLRAFWRNTLKTNCVSKLLFL